MKTRFPFYILPVIVTCILFYGYGYSDLPVDNVNTSSSTSIINPVFDTIVPATFPYPLVFNWYYGNIPGVSGGTVGAIAHSGIWYMNRWNSATNYRYNGDGTNGGPGTVLDSNNAYNTTGAVRDMTIAPDGSGTMYFYGGSASTSLFKLNSVLNRVTSYVHSGSSYRAICWDPNRKGFWASNFSGNILCKDTTGALLGTVVNTNGGKYGLGFDSISVPGNAYLWVWIQDGNPSGTNTHNRLTRIRLSGSGGTSDSTTWIFNLNPIGTGIAGGAEVIMDGPNALLCLNYQNFAVTAHRLNPVQLSLTMNFELCTSLDTIDVQLRNAVSPYNVIESKKGLGGLDLKQTITFAQADASTSYYIAVNHRNAIQTWSAAPVAAGSSGSMSHDFTTAQSQAFGSNQVLVGGQWSFYQGDVNQDEIVDLSDIASIFNDATLFASGYVPTDLNCDAFVDLTDITGAFNNSSNFVSVIKP